MRDAEVPRPSVLITAIHKTCQSSLETVSLEEIISVAKKSRQTDKCILNKQNLLGECCLYCLSKIITVLTKSDHLSYTLHEGMRRLWTDFHDYRFLKPQEVKFLYLFFKNPSCICDHQLKTQIEAIFLPFNRRIRQAFPEVNGQFGLLLFNILVNASIAWRGNANDCILDRPELNQGFEIHCWPKLMKIVKLPLIY